MPIKAMIIDDERLARNELKKLLEQHPEIEIIDEASNVDEGVEKIDLAHPELIFLDIQMPGKTGFDLLAELEKSPKVIFTTAYDEFALKAFEVNALDYLLKPLNPKRLAEAVTRFRIKSVQSAEQSQDGQRLDASKKIFIKDGFDDPLEDFKEYQ